MAILRPAWMPFRASEAIAWRLLTLLLLAIFSWRSELSCQAQQVTAASEAALKATFLFNFTKVVDWPARTFAHAETPFTIGLVGEETIEPHLRKIIRNEFVERRPIELRKVKTPAEMAGCQILFISRSERARVEELLAILRQKPVLTVSEIDRFAERGGMINFVVVDRAIRFEINPGAASACGLKISSKLLSMPKVRLVRPSDQESSRPPDGNDKTSDPSGSGSRNPEP